MRFGQRKLSQPIVPDSKVKMQASTMLWQDIDSGTFYKLNESTGDQVRCDARGVPIRPFNPKITGRFNYEERKRAVAKAHADLGEVEIPS